MVWGGGIAPCPEIFFRFLVWKWRLLVHSGCLPTRWGEPWPLPPPLDPPVATGGRPIWAHCTFMSLYRHSLGGAAACRSKYKPNIACSMRLIYSECGSFCKASQSYELFERLLSTGFFQLWHIHSMLYGQTMVGLILLILHTEISAQWIYSLVQFASPSFRCFFCSHVIRCSKEKIHRAVWCVVKVPPSKELQSVIIKAPCHHSTHAAEPRSIGAHRVTLRSYWISIPRETCLVTSANNRSRTNRIIAHRN